MKHISVEDADF